MEAAAAAGVTRYVMVSFLTAYGEVPDDHPLRAYAIAKIAADRHLQTTDLAWTILGPGLLTLDEPTGAITVARVPKGTPTSKAPTSRGNVARVITAALAERNSDGLRAYEATLRDVADGYSQTDQLIQARLDKFIGVMREE